VEEQASGEGDGHAKFLQKKVFAPSIFFTEYEEAWRMSPVPW